jgi:hypothetical protein
MTKYRRPEEDQAQDEHEAELRAVLDQAVHDGASLVVSMTLGEPPEVVERWVNAFWNGLRDNLSDDRPARAGLKQEDRLGAIALLLKHRVQEEVDAVLGSVRDPL